MPEDNARKCGCGGMQLLATKPGSPVELAGEGGCRIVTREGVLLWTPRWCFVCGGELPENDVKPEPLPEEVAELQRVLRSARTPEDALEELGRPDEEHRWESRKLVFRSRWQTVWAECQVRETGYLSWTWGPKTSPLAG